MSPWVLLPPPSRRRSKPATCAAPSAPRGVGERCRRSPAWTCASSAARSRSEEHTSELQSRLHLVCRLLLEKKKMPSQEIHDSQTASLSPNSRRHPRPESVLG